MGRQRPGTPTLEEVAAHAGVGRGTVSRVINNAAGVKDSTRRIVQQAIEELGYVPNLAARSLASRRTDAVALVLTEPDWRVFSEPFFSEIVRSLGDALADTGMQLMLTLVRSDSERKRFVEYARGGRVDGVLLMSVHAGDRLPDMLAEARLPTVMLGRRSGDEYVSYVDADNVGGARSAVTHLLSRGRRAIATITGPLDMYAAQCRLRGYRDALTLAGLSGVESMVAEGDFSEGSGRRAMAELLERHPEIDGVLAASDTTAAGALQALRTAGRRVPKDVSVIGFDDFALAQRTEPRLTTVRQPLEEMGGSMIRLLLEDMEEPSVAYRHVILRTELVARDST
ncbi:MULTISPECIES: LacI family DNA-binding transcriptional regulator [Streptomyces]|uniref:Catabolite control protein A n=1 Tax=Streptomyces sviceus (strain ATCC 29083 / DSM 924 / JCM 4929 / NBRC 13980 / NCIMB 11184 / NRRL 5439 / UC 5370) TaxID=463191 RepID=B5HPJ9_STRX2|nr:MULTISPECIES: LacI family DNA-binding transcriptional regulator [Streptomyces]EDY54775.1 catabolite control protein A [Streptomyces sviceus ATCC 29083]MYT10584.1 substrate-binding domain-containing protein [Streptomyces sp. SID5470]